MKQDIHNQPLKGILDRELAIAQAQEVIDEWSPYLEELVNHASNLLVRCEKSMKGVEGSPATIIHLYYHMIQMADGIQTLCSNSCFDAAVPLLRSLWEGAISMQYILARDFTDRSNAWLACSYLEEKLVLESLDLSTVSGKRIETMRLYDKYLGNCDLGQDDQKGIKGEIKTLEATLQKPKYKSTLTKLETKKGNYRKWHNINNGASTLRGLAEELKRPLEYEYFYGMFSVLSHAKDARRMLHASEGILSFNHLRSYSNSEMVYSLACSYMADAVVDVSSKFRPGDNSIKELVDILTRHRPEEVSSFSK